VTLGQRQEKAKVYLFSQAPVPPADNATRYIKQYNSKASVTESEPEDMTTGNEMGECSHAKNATYYRHVNGFDIY
jgi:hypothetical protein